MTPKHLWRASYVINSQEHGAEGCKIKVVLQRVTSKRQFVAKLNRLACDSNANN